jgi:drug/metabolite transporter (DMT)-like permease
MGIFFGLLAALGWGVGDYLSRQASQAAGYFRVLLYLQICGAILLGAWLGLAPWLGLLPGPPQAGVDILALALGLALLNITASLLLLRAFAVGVVAVVAPIVAAFSAVSVVLSLLWGDPLSPLRLVGLTATILGVILSSTPGGGPDRAIVSAGAAVALPVAATTVMAQQRRAARALHRLRANVGVGVPEALGAAVGLGAFFWAQRFIVPTLGPYWTTEVSSAASVLLLVPLAWPMRQSLRPPARPVLLRVGLMGACYTGASIAFNLGLGSDSPGVVAVVGSLASPVTVLLAFVLLRERLTRLQWAGVGLIFVALVLLAWPG